VKDDDNGGLGQLSQRVQLVLGLLAEIVTAVGKTPVQGDQMLADVFVKSVSLVHCFTLLLLLKQIYFAFPAENDYYLSLIAAPSVTDPGEVYTGSRIRIFPSRVKNISDPGTGSASKTCFLAVGNMNREVHPGSRFLSHPGSMGDKKVKKHRIPDPQHWLSQNGIKLNARTVNCITFGTMFSNLMPVPISPAARRPSTKS
jgi:hypothetical protein